MKSQHQIIFKRKRPHRKQRPRGPAKLLPPTKKANDVVVAQVVVGERELKFARALSDTEKHVRDAALVSLQTWLQQNAAQLNDLQMAKLWKALFYCIWMADKRKLITQTIHNIVNLTDIAGWPFLNALFDCVAREWPGIDKHRVDKFYEVLNVALQTCIDDVLKSDSEDVLQKLDQFLNLIRTRVLDCTRKSGPGVAMHIFDVYVDRVMLPVLKHTKSMPADTLYKVFDRLMEDVYAFAAPSSSFLLSIGKRVRQRVLKRIIGLVSMDDLQLERTEQRDIVLRFSKRIFVLGADKSTLYNVRASLYSLRNRARIFVVRCDEKKDSEDGKKAMAVETDENKEGDDSDGDSVGEGEEEAEMADGDEDCSEGGEE